MPAPARTYTEVIMSHISASTFSNIIERMRGGSPRETDDALMRHALIASEGHCAHVSPADLQAPVFKSILPGLWSDEAARVGSSDRTAERVSKALARGAHREPLVIVDDASDVDPDVYRIDPDLGKPFP